MSNSLSLAELERLLSSAQSAKEAAAALKQVQVALGRPGLSPEQKTALAIQSAGPTVNLINESDHELKKVALELFASVYPLLFKHVANTSDQQLWTKLVAAKTKMLELWRTGPTGAKVVAVKVIQRIVQTQTPGTADPRRQHLAEPNLSHVRPNHSVLKPAALEDEATKLLEESITALFTSTTPDVICAIAGSLVQLLKIRPGYANLVVTALSHWAPTALAAGCSAIQIRSTEKTIRAALTHLLKSGQVQAFAPQLSNALATQATRMDAAAQLAALEISRKRQLAQQEALDPDAKRRRLEAPNAVAGSSRAPADAFRAPNLDPALAAFDVQSLPLQVVMELVVATLQTVPDATLAAAIEMVRRNLAAAVIAPQRSTTPDAEPRPHLAPAEPIDPLKADLGADDLELKAEVVPDVESDDESEAGEGPQGGAFEVNLADDADLIAPKPLSEVAKTEMIQSALKRICTVGAEGTAPGVWVPLVARLVTRGLRSDPDGEEDPVADKRRDTLRQILFDFVVADLTHRMEFAKLWLNEEWYTHSREPLDTTSDKPRPYDVWLRRLLEHILANSSNKDKQFSAFLVDLPDVPKEEITRLGEMCIRRDQLQLGFAALHDLALLRPPARSRALDVLFGLTTHPDQLTRNAAINTLKTFVPEAEPISGTVQQFALHLFKRMRVDSPPLAREVAKAEEKVEGEEGKEDEDMDDAVSEDEAPSAPPPPPHALVEDGQVVDRLSLPTTVNGVIQQAELLMVLCAKNADLLDAVFENFGSLVDIAQKALPSLITPVVRALGLGHEKLLDIIEACPDGSEELVNRLLTLIADKGKLPGPVIARVRGVAARKALPTKMLVLIVGDCQKDEIVSYLPPIIKTLNGTAEVKSAVRSVFLSVMTPATQAFSAPSARAKPNLLTPVEMMLLLHHQAEEIGLKCAIEAVGICFSMPDAFRPEIWTAFMGRIVDDPKPIPVLFLRTVIQAVTTYKTLAAFVSATLLTRLIGRKIWEQPPLWVGFVRLVKDIAPQSFAALLSLPSEQLSDVMSKQPTLRSPLREYIAKKTGAQANNPRNAALLELLADPVSQEVGEY